MNFILCVLCVATKLKQQKGVDGTIIVVYIFTIPFVAYVITLVIFNKASS